MRVAVVVVLASGCTSPAPMNFEYTATATWTTAATPDVTSMTIDGRLYASGEPYMLDEVYATYDEALASFAPRDVVITTTTGTLQFRIEMTPCNSLSGAMYDGPLITETEDFSAFQVLQPTPSIAFGGGCVTCATKDRAVVSCP